MPQRHLIFSWGGPIFFAPNWSYSLAYFGSATGMTANFWSDFGYAVLLIGVGYWIIARDVSRNRGIVWLGILAKLFDVVNLSHRWIEGLARPIVLIPAAIDGAFTVLFILFLLRRRDSQLNQG